MAKLVNLPLQCSQTAIPLTTNLGVADVVDVVVVAATTTTEDVAIAAIHATLQIHVLTTKVRSMQTPSQHSRGQVLLECQVQGVS